MSFYHCDCGDCIICEADRYQEDTQAEYEKENQYQWVKQDSHIYAWLDQQKPEYTPWGSLIRIAPDDIPF